MNTIKLLIASISVSGVLFLLPVLGVGQAAADSNYEVTLQVLMGSNDGSAKGSLPGNLSAVSQQLRSKVGYSNFRLAGTIIGRMAVKGSFEYKSYSDMFGQDPKFRTFLEVNLVNLKNNISDKASSGVDLDALRFGANVPVVVGYRRDDSGKDQPSVNYERIGLSLGKLGLPENSPTLVGTLDLPNGNEMIFLVVTVKTLDR
ncbi:MAG: hypothetical protein QM785_11850 [Pyrinomonadaceae bacterium]